MKSRTSNQLHLLYILTEMYLLGSKTDKTEVRESFHSAAKQYDVAIFVKNSILRKVLS